MNERQTEIIRMVIEMIEDGAYGLAVSILEELVEDPMGNKTEQDIAELEKILGRNLR
jgi:hypothetical protein